MSSYDSGEAALGKMVRGFLRTRLFRAEFRGDAVGFVAFADATVAAVALLEFEEGFEQARTVEVRPQGVGHKNFRVGDLPEQEVADAHFAAGANEQIGIGEAGG